MHLSDSIEKTTAVFIRNLEYDDDHARRQGRKFRRRIKNARFIRASFWLMTVPDTQRVAEKVSRCTVSTAINGVSKSAFNFANPIEHEL